MVKIRLSRGGTNKRPFYTLVVTDSRQARDGRRIEQVGYFNPIATGGEVRLHLVHDRINYWLSKGAKPSDRVSYLLANQAIESTSASHAKAKAEEK